MNKRLKTIDLSLRLPHRHVEAETLHTLTAKLIVETCVLIFLCCMIVLYVVR